jgi:hypothetical protein
MIKKVLFACFVLATCNYATAQDDINPRRGIVTVKKTGLLAYIKFDEVNYRLIGIDLYGNIIDTAVIQFTMRASINGIAYNETVVGNSLSAHMQQILYRRDNATTLFFTAIKAKDTKGTLLDMPDFKFTFAYTDYDY